jgi:hypothetical protein
MKSIITALLILFTSLILFAGEVTIKIDRMVSLVPAIEDVENENSRFAIHFNMPEDIVESDIIYAEIIIDLDQRAVNYRGNTKVDFQAYGINSYWDEETGNWDNLANRIDSSSFYSYTFDLASDTTISMDITQYIESISQSDSDNFGLMIIPHKLEQRVFHLENQVMDLIRNNARIRIVYFK